MTLECWKDNLSLFSLQPQVLFRKRLLFHNNFSFWFNLISWLLLVCSICIMISLYCKIGSNISTINQGEFFYPLNNFQRKIKYNINSNNQVNAYENIYTINNSEQNNINFKNFEEEIILNLNLNNNNTNNSFCYSQTRSEEWFILNFEVYYYDIINETIKSKTMIEKIYKQDFISENGSFLDIIYSFMPLIIIKQESFFPIKITNLINQYIISTTIDDIYHVVFDKVEKTQTITNNNTNNSDNNKLSPRIILKFSPKIFLTQIYMLNFYRDIFPLLFSFLYFVSFICNYIFIYIQRKLFYNHTSIQIFETKYKTLNEKYPNYNIFNNNKRFVHHLNHYNSGVISSNDSIVNMLSPNNSNNFNNNSNKKNNSNNSLNGNNCISGLNFSFQNGVNCNNNSVSPTPISVVKINVLNKSTTKIYGKSQSNSKHSFFEKSVYIKNNIICCCNKQTKTNIDTLKARIKFKEFFCKFTSLEEIALRLCIGEYIAQKHLQEMELNANMVYIHNNNNNNNGNLSNGHKEQQQQKETNINNKNNMITINNSSQYENGINNNN